MARQFYSLEEVAAILKKLKEMGMADDKSAAIFIKEGLTVKDLEQIAKNGIN